ncbi:hypothetical protein BaRGS_00002252 [Batillaria attramentaria]|uniref:Hexosyltransferase n=1 Tax=Batillaria attramentaria TaxID=370345 RepID=A0ABD0M575_9CAEN
MIRMSLRRLRVPLLLLGVVLLVLTRMYQSDSEKEAFKFPYLPDKVLKDSSSAAPTVSEYTASESTAHFTFTAKKTHVKNGRFVATDNRSGSKETVAVDRTVENLLNSSTEPSGIKASSSKIQYRNMTHIATGTFGNQTNASIHRPISQLATENTGKAVLEFVRSLNESQEEDYLRHNTSYFIPRAQIINAFLPKLIIQTRDLCPKDDLFLLIVVPSVVDKFNERQAIRNTWASPIYGTSTWPRKKLRHSVKIVFFLGVKNASSNSGLLKQESALHGDIVQADFVDSYRNLSIKIAAACHWSATYCGSARHLLKVDSDTFVNLPLLLEFLEIVSARSSHYVLGCNAGQTSSVVRSHPSKWAVGLDEYPFRSYPVYLYGNSYVISGDAIPELLHAYQHMPLVPVEDALFTGILRKVAGVRHIYCPYFAHPSVKRKIDLCPFARDRALTQTGFNHPPGLYVMWKLIRTGKCSASHD